MVGDQLDQGDADIELLLLDGIGLGGQRLIEVLGSLGVIALVLERLRQEHGGLGRGLDLVIFLGDGKIEIAVALGTRHQGHGLGEQSLVVGRILQLGAEQLFEVRAACGARETERSIELRLVLAGILAEEGREPVVLGDDLVGHYLVGIRVFLAEVAEVNGYRLGIGVGTSGSDGVAESAADAGTVVGQVSEILAGLAIEDIGGAALGVAAEILVAQIIHPQQRIDVGFLLGQTLGAVDLVLVDDGAADVDVLRSIGACLDQLAEMLGSGVVILVVASLLEEVAVEDVLLACFGRIAPFGILRTAEVLLGRYGNGAERSSGNEDESNVFHCSENLYVVKFIG